MKQNLKRAGKFYYFYMSKYPWQLLASVVVVIFFAVFNSLAPVYLGKTVQDLTEFLHAWQNGGGSLSQFNLDAGILILCYLLSGLGDFGTSMILSWIGGVATGEMRSGLFNKMQRMRVQYFDTHSDGDILARFTSDLDNIFNAVNEAFVQTFYSIAQIVGSLYMMFSTNTTLAWVGLATTPLALAIAAVNIRVASQAVDQQQNDIGKLNGYINEQVTGQKVIITNGLQEDSIAGFETLNQTVKKTALRGQIWSGILQPLMNGMMLLTSAVVIFGGSWIVMQGGMSTGAALALIVVFVQYAQNYFQCIMQMTSMYGQIQLAITGARRVSEVHEQPDEVKPAHGLPVSEVHDEVVIDNVRFGYQPGKEILHGVTLKAKRGEMVALVGPTGAGKTTVINLLNRFYDVDAGAITIDGVDIRELDLTQLRDTVGIVLQDPQLFSGTIAENICFGKPDATEAEMYAAAEQAHIHDFITSLPDGYQTQISDEQSVFSAGQKQLVSIARTILTNPRILILDEATSNVDTVTEKKIQAAMDNVISGRTSFVIAHRLKTILKADDIAVLRDGRIVEEGTHAQLLEEKGFYAGLYKSQMVFN
ncbi:ABC transporter ATP-binding protein [Lacticaseibacillus sharpeae]|uniref:ABC transporter ATP-binding protein n=1 Tax=Lacticaseibacillus sharpeae JCM 1186 = DSM 20505 TaxID=1291052 RepID=A0A0R1ZKN3_9LACO|nr:ABC transporter ATP-binding protein [Lacticaseibacillus sharpeae]KRM55013.1 ABC transporter ATP-binding protein [Lacticaseibacillus sharpeae JCM 1186 = DSM 20505]